MTKNILLFFGLTLMLASCNGTSGSKKQDNASDSSNTQEQVELQQTVFTINFQKRPVGEPVEATITYDDGRTFVVLKDSLAPTSFPITPLYLKLAEDPSGQPVVSHTTSIPFDSIQHNDTTLRILQSSDLEVHILVQDPGDPNHFTEAGLKKGKLANADEDNTEK